MIIALVMTAGSMLVVFIGESISMHGIGNGTSLIIFSGIIARIPSDLYTYYNDRFVDAGSDLMNNILFSVALLIAILLVSCSLCTFNKLNVKSPFNIPSVLPVRINPRICLLKINSVGVIPVIFASSFMMTPQTILGFFAASQSEASWYQILSTIFNYREPIGATIYTVLIVVFTYFYAFIQINPEKWQRTCESKAAIFQVYARVKGQKITFPV